MKMSISETANLFGVSVRTLHYYDEIGLVKPSQITDAGYRLYDEEAISVLQQVLFYRELEFSLKEIKEIMTDPCYDKTATLKNHKDLLLLKKKHIDSLISLVDNCIGGNTMSEKITTIKDIKDAEKKYADEVKSRWGNTDEYKQSQSKTLTDDEKLEQAEKANEIFGKFASCVGKDPACDEIQALVGAWQAHITKYYYECTKPVLACLGQMYTGDERFRSNLDSFGDGTAQLMSDAISIYCK